MADVFEVQDDISRRIAGALMPQLQEYEHERAARLSPDALSVHELCWRGMAQLWRYTPASLAESKELLRQAVDENPTHGRAHALLGFVEHITVLMGWSADAAAAVASTQRHAQEAVRHDRHDPLAQMTLAAAFMQTRQMDRAAEACRNAVDLAPSFANGHHLLGICELMRGDADAALAHNELAMRLSPKDPFRWFHKTVIGLAHYVRRDYDPAASWSQAAISERPDFSFPHFNLAAAEGQRGDSAAAAAALAGALTLVPAPSMAFMQTAWPFAKAEDFAHLMDGLRKAGLTL